ncbi:MAG: cytochrome C, partial [Cyclobacteriaceae bacterium]|nr:cytochrome C [Cyclobacteriaceae bacterium]
MKNVNVLKKISNLLVVLTGIILALLVMILILAKNPKILQKPTISQIEKKLSDVENSFPNGYEGKKIKYGYRLVSESSKWMGPEAVNPENRYAGNNLACKNCHLNIGTKAGSASWVGISNRFPQFR